MFDKKIIGILFMVVVVLILASSISSAATDIEYKTGTQVKYQSEISGVKEIQFIAECNGIMTISSAENRIDILSSCKPRNLYVQFIIPNDRAVYQTKDITGQKVAIRVLQKRIATSGDGKYNIVLTKPESTGRFEFLGDAINQDDTFIIENAADQTLKANIKMIDAETIMQKDNELYNSLQATNLSSIDKMFFKRVKNTMETLGLDKLLTNINREISRLIGGK